MTTTTFSSLISKGKPPNYDIAPLVPRQEQDRIGHLVTNALIGCSQNELYHEQQWPIPIEGKVNIRVENIVLTCSANVNIELMHAVTKLAKYGAQWCPALIIAVICRFRFGPLTTTVLLYRNGNLVYMGSNTVEALRDGIIFFLHLLRSIGYTDAYISDPCIENVVSKATFDWKVNLDQLQDNYRRYVSYDSVNFPGGVIRELSCMDLDPETRRVVPVGYRTPMQRTSPKVTVTVFRKGNMVITGAKRFADSMKAMRLAFYMILPYCTESILTEEPVPPAVSRSNYSSSKRTLSYQTTFQQSSYVESEYKGRTLSAKRIKNKWNEIMEKRGGVKKEEEEQD